MELLKTLESETCNVLNWFTMLVDINHRYYSSHSYIYLDNAFLENEESVKLLVVQIDKNLDFEEHITSLVKEGNQKLYALMRISKYLTKDKLRLIMKTFIESQFNPFKNYSLLQ